MSSTIEVNDNAPTAISPFPACGLQPIRSWNWRFGRSTAGWQGNCQAVALRRVPLTR